MTVDKMAPRRGEFKSAVEVRRPPLARPPAPPPAPAPTTMGTTVPRADLQYTALPGFS